MVGTCPNVGEAERHVHRLVEVDDLEGGEALVVVKGDRDIEFPPQLATEEGVRRLGAGEPGKAPAQPVENGVDEVPLLGPEEAALPRRAD